MDKKEYMKKYYLKHREDNGKIKTKQEAKTYLNTLLLNTPQGLTFPAIMEHLKDKELRVGLFRHRISNYLGCDSELYKDGNLWKHSLNDEERWGEQPKNALNSNITTSPPMEGK